MKTALVMLALLFLSGCAEADDQAEQGVKVGPGNMYVWSDSAKGVTCYVWRSYGGSAGMQCFLSESLKDSPNDKKDAAKPAIM